MARGPSPLLGFNTNIRHGGKLYHVQTEDSGVAHPHITTHLFADGGRIVASRKTDYAAHVAAADVSTIVKKLMQEQHKAMCIALRDGAYDDAPKPAAAPAAKATATVAQRPSAHAEGRRASKPPARRPSLPPPDASAAATATTRASRPPPAKRASLPPPAGRASRRPPAPRAIDVDAFERAAEARIAESAIARAPQRRRKTRDPASSAATRTAARPVRGKTLDDVILTYLRDERRKAEK